MEAAGATRRSLLCNKAGRLAAVTPALTGFRGQDVALRRSPLDSWATG